MEVRNAASNVFGSGFVEHLVLIYVQAFNKGWVPEIRSLHRCQDAICISEKSCFTSPYANLMASSSLCVVRFITAAWPKSE